jgi:hypothetical protein
MRMPITDKSDDYLLLMSVADVLSSLNLLQHPAVPVPKI